MTTLIAAGSLKSDRAIRFGRALEAAMKRRGVGTRTISEAIPCGRTAVMYWRTGRILPRIEMARKLAEALAAPHLTELAIALRKKRCVVCDVEIVDDSGSDNRLYCSLSCRGVRGKQTVGVDRRARAALAERALLVHQRAVAAFCGACEPEGRCYAADCQLRPASPLPLADDRLPIDRVQPKPHNGYRERGADSARQVRVWAGYTPEDRAARIAKTAEASKRGRGLVPA